MLRVVAHKSAAAARQYYAEGLKREDYYSEKQEIIGRWHGWTAELLGLTGNVTGEAFAALAENRHPTTGERLTLRTNADRIVGYDLNFHAPKSLSVLYGLTRDDDLLQAFRGAVAETMAEIEERTATRVRRRGAMGDRVTGNLAWAEFVHLTARPVGGVPDPHLHVHGFAFNVTFDREEERWKAAKFHDIKKEASHSEAVFHSRLTAKLAALGYGIERTRQGWEVAGVPQSVIEKFSRRTAEIERLAEARGITDAKRKDALGAASREGKRRGLTRSDLIAAWEARLTAEERTALANVSRDKGNGQGRPPVTAAEALDYACDKLFAKHSVVERGRLLAEAMRYGVGNLTPEAVRAEFARRGMIERTVQGDRLCTSVEVLAEEVSLIHFARTGRGLFAPLNPRHTRFGDARLSAEQRAAVRHLLSSKDQVIALRGAAGVGKTTLMQEAVSAIEAGGRRVFAFAPSAAASRGTLREAGFANAETVAHLLSNPKLQTAVRGQVLWIDEAGLLGVRDLWRIMQVAGSSTRVILTGDTRQHAPVARGDAFRLLQCHAGLPVAEVTQIRRQESEAYRRAVAALSQGDLSAAFRRLDARGAIVEVPDDAERYKQLAQDYLDLTRRGKGTPPLVVSPTHAEGAKVTAAIREAKREAGQLGAERTFARYHNLQWEEADRRRAENYGAGLVVQFHQNAPGIRRGELFHVLGRDENGAVRMENTSGRQVALPLDHAARFQVFEKRDIALAAGDRIRVTRNGETADGRKISNGYLFTVDGFNRKGQLVLHTGAVLDADHGHLAYGYCQTSHSAQSKSVRDVLVAQSADSFAAGSREQFYVSASRGKETLRIYTDDRAGLQAAVGNTSTRISGVEFAGLTARELASFAGMEMNAKQWRESVQSRRAEGEAKNFVGNLLKERRAEAATRKQESGLDWRQYIEMRRQVTGPDGKHRSKGQPGGQGQKQGYTDTKKRSFIRPTSPPTEATVKKTTEKQAKPVEQKPAPTAGRAARVAKMFQSAANHLQQVAARRRRTPVTGQGQPEGQRRVRLDKTGTLPLQTNHAGRNAQHAVKERAADTGKKVAQNVKVQTATAVRRR